MINGEVHLFDCLFNGTLKPSAELQIAQLYKPLIRSNGSVVPIQQQETNNCGLFSIAVAYHAAIRSEHTMQLSEVTLVYRVKNFVLLDQLHKT